MALSGLRMFELNNYFKEFRKIYSVNFGVKQCLWKRADQTISLKEEYAILVVGGHFLSAAFHLEKLQKGSKATLNQFQVFGGGEEGKKELWKYLNNNMQMVRKIAQARPPQATPSQATSSSSSLYICLG